MSSNFDYYSLSNYQGFHYNSISAGNPNTSVATNLPAPATMNSFMLDPGVIIILYSGSSASVQYENTNIQDLSISMGATPVIFDYRNDKVNTPYGYSLKPGQYIANSGGDNFAFQVKTNVAGPAGFFYPNTNQKFYPATNTSDLVVRNMLPNGFGFQTYYGQVAASGSGYYYYYRLKYSVVEVPTYKIYKNCSNSRFVADTDCGQFFSSNCRSAAQMATSNCQDYCSKNMNDCQIGFEAYCSVLDNVVNPFCSKWCLNNRAACDPLMYNYCGRHTNNTGICGCINSFALTGLKMLMDYYGQPYAVQCNSSDCLNSMAYKTKTMIDSKCSPTAICIQNVNLQATDLKVGNVDQSCSIGLNENSGAGNIPSVGNDVDVNAIIQQYIIKYAPYAIAIFIVIISLLLIAIFRRR